jgi:hypothetical protein
MAGFEHHLFSKYVSRHTVCLWPKLSSEDQGRGIPAATQCLDQDNAGDYPAAENCDSHPNRSPINKFV